MLLKRFAIAVAIAGIFVALATAQTAQSMVLEFVDGEELTVVYPDSTSYSFASGSIQEGDSIPIGATVKTGVSTSAELRMKPNGTIIKLAKKTTFKIDGLATQEKNQSGFTLVAGKIRAVAAVGSQYNVYTSSTVAGVRGTDFSMSFEEGLKATLLVAKGKVEFGTRQGDAIANAIMVGAGQFADLFKGMVAAAYTPEQLAEEYDGVDITPDKMPVQAEDPVAETTSAETVAETETAPAEAPPEETEAKDPAKETESKFVSWLGEMLGMEIGSLTINGETWAKAVIQPTFQIGKLKAGLYLPIIYRNDLFDPSDWYHPAGNDEWSFGVDIGWNEDHWFDALSDAASDIALKIKFLEYGQPLVDPFFVKVGNLDSFTVGHGLIMRNYANDADFPSVRHIGLNFGLDFGEWGFEALTNDITDNQIVGGRLYLRPIAGSKVAVGFSGVADLFPASILNTEADPDAAADFGDPIFIGTGLDLDVPIVSNDLMSIRFFVDGAVMVPYVRNEFTDLALNTASSGLRFDMVYDGASIKNWGAASGLMGNVLFIDWRLEYRYFTGAFTPAFFDAGYERRRSDLVREWADYLTGAESIDQSPSVMGIYGEGGVSLLKDKLSFEFGYFWPWSADATSLDEQLSMSDDYFKAALMVKKGVIPIIDIAGGISYERRGLAKAIANGTLDRLFDENTTFSGEIAFPVPGAPNLDLAFIVSTAIERDENGDVVFAGTQPSIVPSVTLETRLHF